MGLIPKTDVSANEYELNTDSEKAEPENLSYKFLKPDEDDIKFTNTSDVRAYINYYDIDGEEIESKEFVQESGSEVKTHTVLDYPKTGGKLSYDQFYSWWVKSVSFGSGGLKEIDLLAVSNNHKKINYDFKADTNHDYTNNTNYMNHEKNCNWYEPGIKMNINPALKYTSGEWSSVDFVGWFRNVDFSGDPVTYISESETEDITLYALFKGDEYAIRYRDASDGTDVGSEKSDAYFADETNHPSNYVGGIGTSILTGGFCDAKKNNYTFYGWYSEQDCINKINGLSRTDSGDKEIWAKFTPNSYNINYNANGGELKTGETNPTTYTYGNSEKINDLVRKGYTFEGWYNKDDYSGSQVTQITKDNVNLLLNTSGNTINLYAKFTPMTATLTLDDDNPTTAGSAESYTLTYDGDMPQITLPVKENYIFDGYYLDDVQFVKADGDWNDINGLIESKKWKSENSSLNLTAKWKADSFEIAYDLNGGTNDANNPTSYT